MAAPNDGNAIKDEKRMYDDDEEEEDEDGAWSLGGHLLGT